MPMLDLYRGRFGQSLYVITFFIFFTLVDVHLGVYLRKYARSLLVKKLSNDQQWNIVIFCYREEWGSTNLVTENLQYRSTNTNVGSMVYQHWDNY